MGYLLALLVSLRLQLRPLPLFHQESHFTFQVASVALSSDLIYIYIYEVICEFGAIYEVKQTRYAREQYERCLDCRGPHLLPLSCHKSASISGIASNMHMKGPSLLGSIMQHAKIREASPLLIHSVLCRERMSWQEDIYLTQILNFQKNSVCTHVFPC